MAVGPVILISNDDIDYSRGNYYSAVQMNLAQNTTEYIRIRSGNPEIPAGSYRLECYYGAVGTSDRSMGQIKAMYR